MSKIMMLPVDRGRAFIKSMATWDQWASVVGSGNTESVQEILDMGHVEHEDMT